MICFNNCFLHFFGNIGQIVCRLTNSRKKFVLTKTCFGLKEEFLEEPNFVKRLMHAVPLVIKNLVKRLADAPQ
jgi:hypothetical protein